MNLRFRAPWNTVLATLAADDWKTPGLTNGRLPAVDQYLCDTQPGRKQDAQRVKTIFPLIARYHVRLWSYAAGAESLGSAHAETMSFPEGHVVMTFESGEQEVALGLARAGWKVHRDADYQEFFRDSKFDSGRLTEIDPP